MKYTNDEYKVLESFFGEVLYITEERIVQKSGLDEIKVRAILTKLCQQGDVLVERYPAATVYMCKVCWDMIRESVDSYALI